MPPVPTSEWGGLLVTLVVAITGIVASLPLGVLLALGRRSDMPAIRMLSIIFIEFWRGVPLVTVLFMASVMLPLFLPEGFSPDNLLRCLASVLRSFPLPMRRRSCAAVCSRFRAGQYEAARAVGLTYWQAMTQVALPQALRHVIPGIVNTFIGLFKDTTLVVFVGLSDPIGFSNLIRATTDWNGIYWELFIFIGLCFFICCFSMSKYSQFLERKLRTEHR